MRLIDADKFEVVGGIVPEEYDVDSYLAGTCEILEMIDNAATVDAEPVRHGLWLRPSFDPAWVKCSECGCYWEGGIVENCNMYYCPNCGAKMDTEVNNDA